MNETAKQWSGAALAGLALVCTTVIAVLDPGLFDRTTVAVLLTAFGLRATGLVSHAFTKLSGGDKE